MLVVTLVADSQVAVDGKIHQMWLVITKGKVHFKFRPLSFAHLTDTSTNHHQRTAAATHTIGLEQDLWWLGTFEMHDKTTSNAIYY